MSAKSIEVESSSSLACSSEPEDNSKGPDVHCDLIMAVECHKRRNIGPLIRCATVWGVKTLVVVGSKQFGTHGAHGSNLRLRTLYFDTWSEAFIYLKADDKNAIKYEEGNISTFFYGICSSPLYDDDASTSELLSIPLNSYQFPSVSNIQSRVVFCIGPQKGNLMDMIHFLDCALHVELSFPTISIDKGKPSFIDTIVTPLQEHFNNCIKFENKVSLVMDRFVSTVLPPQKVSVFTGEKFHVIQKISAQDDEITRDMRSKKKLIKENTNFLGSEVEVGDGDAGFFSNIFD